ncbi:hypothetical protein NECAME_14841 [Necator americanus]|uniref:Uncharacterized protein n=1 Tax=Necator americanus TaxID=51031 RepID=W2SNC0_NECAM|nr:hypothetical protein NECAME_14841 [Necator americanus]ETN70331.1 hypothetical protein NECAME_14841 [Necator americanus]
MIFDAPGRIACARYYAVHGAQTTGVWHRESVLVAAWIEDFLSVVCFRLPHSFVSIMNHCRPRLGMDY